VPNQALPAHPTPADDDEDDIFGDLDDDEGR